MTITMIKLSETEALLQAKIDWTRSELDRLIDERAAVEFGTEDYSAKTHEFTIQIERLKVVRDTLGNVKMHLRHCEAYEAPVNGQGRPALEPGIFSMSSDGRERRVEIG